MCSNEGLYVQQPLLTRKKKKVEYMRYEEIEEKAQRASSQPILKEANDNNNNK